ncbi:sulfite exporter TauE/SafE family protein [Thalassotalea fusca]
MDLTVILQLIALGVIAGIASGLLGIGGGGIMVPVLTSLFIAIGVPNDQVVHLALGTSMAAIVVTSISSALAHHRNQNVIWSVVKGVSPGIIVGAFAATFLVAQLSTLFLGMFFAVFMAIVAVQMFKNSKPKPSRTLPKPLGLSVVGSGIGAISSMVSIGGGSMSVPYLVWHNVHIKQAIGTSAALGVAISIAGSAGFVYNGWAQATNDSFIIGFIYWPAVLIISCCTMIFAPIGANWANRLPVAFLKKIFACLLLLLSLKMCIQLW